MPPPDGNNPLTPDVLNIMKPAQDTLRPVESAIGSAWSNLVGTAEHTYEDAKTALTQGPKVGLPPSIALGGQKQVAAQAQENDLWGQLQRAPKAVHDWIASDPAKAVLAREAVDPLSGLAKVVETTMGSVGNTPTAEGATVGSDISSAWTSGLAGIKKGAEDYQNATGGWTQPFQQAWGGIEAAGGVASIIGAPVSPAIHAAAGYLGKTGTLPTYAPFEASEANVLRGGQPISPAADAGPKEATNYWRNTIDMYAPFLVPPVGAAAKAAKLGEEGAEGLAGGAHAAEPPPVPPPTGPAPRAAPAPASNWSVGEGGWYTHPDGAPMYFTTPQDAAKFAARSGQDLPGRPELRAFTHQDQTVWGLQRVATEGPSSPEMATAQAEQKVEDVKAATEAASTVPFHAEMPEATEDFLHNHTGAGSQLAHLDPITLYNLAEQGHLPFPEMIEATANALANGGRVSVPMSSYIARVAGQPFEDALHRTTQFGEGPSLSEAASGQAPLSGPLNAVRPSANWTFDTTGAVIRNDGSLITTPTAQEAFRLAAAIEPHLPEGQGIHVVAAPDYVGGGYAVQLGSARSSATSPLAVQAASGVNAGYLNQIVQAAREEGVQGRDAVRAFISRLPQQMQNWQVRVLTSSVRAHSGQLMDPDQLAAMEYQGSSATIPLSEYLHLHTSGPPLSPEFHNEVGVGRDRAEAFSARSVEDWAKRPLTPLKREEFPLLSSTRQQKGVGTEGRFAYAGGPLESAVKTTSNGVRYIDNHSTPAGDFHDLAVKIGDGAWEEIEQAVQTAMDEARKLLAWERPLQGERILRRDSGLVYNKEVFGLSYQPSLVDHAQGEFINPFNAGMVEGAKATPLSVVDGIVGTISHELAHIWFRQHDEAHTATTEEIRDLIVEAGKILPDLDDVFQRNWATFEKVAEEYNNEQAVQPAKRFEGRWWNDSGGQARQAPAASGVSGVAESSATEAATGGGTGGGGGGGNGEGEPPDREWPSDKGRGERADSSQQRLEQQRGVLLASSHQLLARHAIGGAWAETAAAKDAWDRLANTIANAADREALRRAEAGEKPDFKEFAEAQTERAKRALQARSDVDLLSDLERKGGVRFLLDEDETAPPPGFPQKWWGGKGAKLPEDVAAEFGFPSAQSMFSAISDLNAQMVIGGQKTVGEWVKATSETMGQKAAIANFRSWDLDPAQAEKWAERWLHANLTRKYLEASLKDVAMHDVGGEPLTLGEVYGRVAINQLRKEAKSSWNVMPAGEGTDLGKFRALMEERGAAFANHYKDRDLAADDFVEANQANEQAFGERRRQLRVMLQLQQGVFTDRAIRAAWGMLKEIAGYKGLTPSSFDPETFKLLRYLAVKLDVERPPEVEAATDEEGNELPFSRQEMVEKKQAGKALEAQATKALGLTDPAGWRARMSVLGYEPVISRGVGPGIVPFRRGPDATGTQRPSIAAREIALMVHSMYHIGKDLMTAGGRGVAGSLEEVGQAAKAQADARGRFNAPAAVVGRPTLAEVGQWWLGNVTRPEKMLFWMDGERPGLFSKSLVEPLDKKEKWRRNLSGTFAGMDRKVIRTIGGRAWIKSLKEQVGDRIPSAHIQTDSGLFQSILTKGDAIGAALHFGTEDGLETLAGGIGADPARLEEEVKAVLTKEDKDYIKNMWAKMGNRKVLDGYRALERAARGARRPYDPGRSVLFGEGEDWEEEVEGSYWPAHYQWESGTPEGGPALGGTHLFGTNYRSALKEGPEDTAARIRSNYSRQVNIGFSALSHQLNAVLSDLAYRPAVIRGARMLQIPSVREALRDVLGPTYLDQLDKWMKYVSNLGVYDPSSINPAYNFLLQARSNFMIAEVAANHATFLRHSSVALSHMIGKGTTYLPRAAWDLTLGNRQASWKWVLENSGEVRRALTSLDWDIDEAVERIAESGGKALILKGTSLMFTVPKMWESGITFRAVYDASIDKGLSEEDAKEQADIAVRDTQGAVGNIHRPAIARMDRSAIGVIASQGFIFQSFMNAQFNMLWLASREAQRGNRLLKDLQVENASIERDATRAGTEEEKAAIEDRREKAKARAKEGKADLKQAMWNRIWFGLVPALAITFGAEKLIDSKETLAQRAVRGAEGLLGGAAAYGETVFGAARDFFGTEEKARTGSAGKLAGTFGQNLPQGEILSTFAHLGADAFNALVYGKLVDRQFPTNAANALGFGAGLPTKEPGRLAQGWWNQHVMPKPTPRHRVARRRRAAPGFIRLWGGQPAAPSEGGSAAGLPQAD